MRSFVEIARGEIRPFTFSTMGRDEASNHHGSCGAAATHLTVEDIVLTIDSGLQRVNKIIEDFRSGTHFIRDWDSVVNAMRNKRQRGRGK